MADGSTYKDLGPDGKHYTIASPEAVDLLESIMPADKAQAVPYVLLWEIDPVTGQAAHPSDQQTGIPKKPLSVLLVSPPAFGASLSGGKDEDVRRFRERAPVSLERISVKNVNRRGLISYREVSLAFVVHRPDVVFDKHITVDSDGNATHAKSDGDSWSSFLFPGQVFGLEYGWSASSHVKNGILNGEGFSDPPKGVIIPGRVQIRFAVTHYNFKIESDGQIRVNVQGMESGELNLRQTFITGEQEDSKKSQSIKRKKNVDPTAKNYLEKLLKKVQDKVASDEKSTKKTGQGGKVVKFGDLFDIVFGEELKKAYKEAGFNDIQVFIGRFNTRAGQPAKKYSNGNSVSDKPISEFTFPLDNIENVFRSLYSAGQQLTLSNFMDPFIKKFNDDSIWTFDGKKPSQHTNPQITMRSVLKRGSNGKQDVFFYIFDAHREFTKFSSDDEKKEPKKFNSRNEIREHLRGMGIPFVSLTRGNSYIQETNFSVMQDDQMKNIMIRKAVGKDDVTREQKHAQPDAAKKQRNRSVEKLYASAIQGNITMLGNFVLDTFSLLWLDFGVSQWDGPFSVLEKEDVIERGSFTTTVSIVSAGTDPLRTQGG